MTQTLTSNAEHALNQVLALRKLSYDNSTITRRSQNVVLQSLNAPDTIAVAAALAEHEKKFGW